jgi:hypothetical protein
MTAHVNSVSYSAQVAPAATSQPPAKPTNTEKPAAGRALAQDSVNISTAGRAASQAQPPQKASGDVDHDADSK